MFESVLESFFSGDAALLQSIGAMLLEMNVHVCLYIYIYMCVCVIYAYLSFVQYTNTNNYNGLDARLKIFTNTLVKVYILHINYGGCKL